MTSEIDIHVLYKPLSAGVIRKNIWQLNEFSFIIINNLQSKKSLSHINRAGQYFLSKPTLHKLILFSGTIQK